MIIKTESEEMNGIDVSQWQGDIDFEAVRRANVELVYIKASEGTDWVDPFFFRNYAGADRAGLPVGFYHYLTAQNEKEAKAEAHHFVSTVEGLVNDARLVMDIEDIRGLTDEEVNQIAGAFLQDVQEYTGKLPAIYAGADNAAQILGEEFAMYPLWIAEYDVPRPTMENVWETWAGWQYTDMGRVAGIQEHVDRDIFTEEMLEQEREPIRIESKPFFYPMKSENYYIYRIKRGDTLFSIAKKLGIEEKRIELFNRIKEPNLIYAGQKLKIPVGK